MRELLLVQLVLLQLISLLLRQSATARASAHIFGRSTFRILSLLGQVLVTISLILLELRLQTLQLLLLAFLVRGLLIVRHLLLLQERVALLSVCLELLAELVGALLALQLLL